MFTYLLVYVFHPEREREKEIESYSRFNEEEKKNVPDIPILTRRTYYTKESNRILSIYTE